ncbi:TMEM175 family protein [Subtercola frigoramans]|uniref:Membrane protein n=1 Tax=Subtercola frigoramans TaxID=120298 RepID=A0ABS2L7I4_9MICO|nr:TMEM175 family protein [Subtercola frigoramans]MBM7473066.1 putative membrane protein [Subtercola frigoramans]
MGKARLEAFSDGVMAVAITLLVLDLHTSASTGVPLGQQLVEEWPSFLAYVLSFFVIGTIWVNHHMMFRRVVEVDRLTMLYNLLLLLFVSTIPFTTSTLAEFIQDGGEDARVAVILYGSVSFAMSVCFTLLLQRIFSRDLIRQNIDQRSRRIALRRFGVGLVLYPVATVVGLFSPIVMMVGLIALALYYLVGSSGVIPEEWFESSEHASDDRIDGAV